MPVSVELDERLVLECLEHGCEDPEIVGYVYGVGTDRDYMEACRILREMLGRLGFVDCVEIDECIVSRDGSSLRVYLSYSGAEGEYDILAESA